MAEWFAQGGVTELILAVNHLSDKLRIEVAREKLEAKTVLSVEETSLGTGGPISFAKPMLSKDEPLIIANGDVISDIDLRGLIAAHTRTGAEATVALVSVEDPRPFGLATLDANDRIIGFEEKSEAKHNPGWINAFWYDIGKIPDYIIANRELLKRPEYQKTDKREKKGQMLEITEPSFVGRNCILESGIKLGPNAILSERVSMKKGAVVRETIVFEQTTLSENCLVEDSIIGEGVTVGKDAKIGKGSIIAGQVVLPEGAVIKPGSIVLN